MIENSPSPWPILIQVADAPRDVPEDSAGALRRIQDEMAIRDLVIRYAYYHDARMIDAKVNLHHRDCVVHHRSGTLRGIDAIRAFFEAGPPNAQIRDMKHYVTNTLVRFFDRDTAVATSFYVWAQTWVGPDSSTSAALGGGWYVDHVGRFENAWLFTERTFYRDFDFKLPGVPSFGALLIGSEALPAESLEQLMTAGLLERPTTHPQPPSPFGRGSG